MKKLIIFLILSSFLNLESQQNNNSNFKLQELTGGKKELKERKRQWENEVNAIEEGISWEAINQESIYSKYLSNQQKHNVSKGDELLSAEVLANGRLKGTWSERGSNNQAGRMHCADIDFENDLIYAASSGGHIWRGTIEGKDWTCLNNSLQFNNIQFVKALKVNGNNRVMAVAGGGSTIWLTDDEGQSWRQANGIETVNQGNYIKRTQVLNNSEQTIYTLRDVNAKTVLYRSTDQGENFSQIVELDANASICDIWAPQWAPDKDSDDIYLVRADSLFTADGSGLIFIRTLPDEIISNLIKPRNVHLSGAFYQSEVQFAVHWENESFNNYVITSTDNGETWENNALPPDISLFLNKSNSFATSTYTVSYIYFGSVELHHSQDRGESWHIVNEWEDYYGDEERKLHADIPGIQFFRDPDNEFDEIMLISTDGGLYISYDYLSNVKNISLKDLNVGQYYSIYTSESNPDIIFLGAQDQGFQIAYKDLPGTLGFDQVMSGDFGSINSSDEGENVWSVYPDFVQLFANAQSSQFTLLRWDFEGYNWQWMTPTVAINDIPRAAFLIGGDEQSGSYLWKATIAQSWKNLNSVKVSPEMKSAYDANLTALALRENNIIMCLSKDGKYLQSTGGVNWEVSEILDEEDQSKNTYGRDVYYDEANQIIYAALSGYSVEGFHFSTDDGRTWEAATDGLPNTAIWEIDMTPDGGALFAATAVGPYLYIPYLKKWYDMTGGSAPNTDYRSVEYLPHNNTVRFATYGRGVWDFKIDEIVSVENLEPTDKFSVKNFPNPAYTTSNLGVKIESNEPYVINVYNSDGRKIKQLFEGRLKAGENHFNWDLTDGAGANVPNGMYYYTISSDGITQYSKVIVNR